MQTILLVKNRIKKLYLKIPFFLNTTSNTCTDSDTTKMDTRLLDRMICHKKTVGETGSIVVLFENLTGTK